MIRVFAFNLFILLCCIYFGFHLVWGQKGYIKYREVYSIFENKEREVAKIEAQRVVLEGKNSLFSRNALDLDALDEYARRALGIAGRGDYVIPVIGVIQKK
jgi:cell division protein FtsB